LIRANGLARFVVSACLVAGCGSTSQAPGDTTGVSATEIVIGSPQPMSGATKFYGDWEIPAIQAAFSRVNSEGGVYGRKLKLVTADAGCTSSSQAVEAGRQVLDAEHAFALLDTECAPVVGAINDTLLKGTNIVNLSITGAARLSQPHPKPADIGYTFYFTPNTATQMAAMLNFAHKNLSPQPQKIGILASTDTYGADGIVGIQSAAASYGYPISDVERVAQTATNVSVEMARIRASGADTVILVCFPAPTTAALTSALQLNYRPYFLGATAASSPNIFQALPYQAYSRFYGLYTGQIPRGSAQEKAYLAQFQPYATQTLTSDNTLGLGMSQILVEYLRRADKNLTRESFIRALYAGPVQNDYLGTVNIAKGGPLEALRQVTVVQFDAGKNQVGLPGRWSPDVAIQGIDA
jgi:ABC-type branched-subunit amino acid transport system substrate-binding protein